MRQARSTGVAKPHATTPATLSGTMSAESLTQRWLRQNVSSYPHKDRLFLDIDTSLARFPTVRPKSDVYTYDDGRTQLLLCLHGVLPISFKAASYNIPIAVWITKDYPRQPPIVYVVPTQDMLVRSSKHVDVSGRCSIDYIQHWERKSEACNLSALLEALQQEFSRGPPVYAKPKPATPSSPSPLQHQHQPSTSPPPSGHTGDRPALPPKPSSTSASIQLAQKSQAVVPNVSSPANSNLLNRPPPPLPPQINSPPTYSSRSSGHHHMATNPSDGIIPRDPVLSSDHHNYRWSVPPASPALSGQFNQSHASNMPSPVPLQYPQGPPPPLPTTWSQATVSPRSTPNLLDEESADPLSPAPKARATAPPRPPNPELLRLHAQVHDKIGSELSSLSQVVILDTERLQAQQSDLLAGEPAIRDEMARLEAVRDVCRHVSSRLRNTVEQAERNIAELRKKGDPEVDELICSTSIVHNQLINLVAEDNAIEDTIYHLHRGLNTGRIDLERFLRSTRVLAEEQFTKRALIEKIQLGIPVGRYS